MGLLLSKGLLKIQRVDDMKIKLLKDIPGYKAGEIVDIPDDTVFYAKSIVQGFPNSTIGEALANGWAEEVKDEIDMEEVRNRFRERNIWDSDYQPSEKEKQETQFFNAYRIVKHVIDTLNGDWKADWNNSQQTKYIIGYDHAYVATIILTGMVCKRGISLKCKDPKTAEKIISLCEPELKVLFGVK